jgi:parallel beta-helix repeat protein
LTIRSTTINANKGGSEVYTGDGGGVFNDNGVLSVINSTISGNTCFGNGGGIYGSATITNCTISGNNAPLGGGGIYAGLLEIGNTILKTGSSGSNILCSGGTSHGYNLSDDNGGGILTAPGDQINTDPMLGPFRNNGGTTFTHTLLAGSPAIDAGDPNFTPPPLSDQRGYVRIYNGRIDIGAVEAQITIIGTMTYCAEPDFPPPVPNVTLTVTGSESGSTLSDGEGNYTFLSLPFGGNYTVTPTKPALAPGSPGINTIDVVAVQRHYLQIAFLSGCPLQAADVNGDFNINTVDVVAIQRFYLVMPSGTANVGNYEFFPASRSYQGIVSDQTGQNYSTLIFGDVVSPFAD